MANGRTTSTTKRPYAVRVPMGTQDPVQLRLDKIDIEGVPLLDEFKAFYVQTYQDLPGGPPLNEFLAKLAYVGMQTLRKRATGKLTPTPPQEAFAKKRGGQA